MATVTIRDLHKRYAEGFHAVRGISLDIADGEFLVLVGPSGCGKSTTLRMVAGLEEVTSGEIRIGDRVVNDVAPGDRDIAMVFQNYALYPHLSVRENMAFGLKMRGTPAAEIDRRVADAAAALSIEHLLARRPRELSGGQRQRVAIARCLAMRPEIILFDEPTSALDPTMVREVLSVIRRLAREGMTMLIVTHEMDFARDVSHRVFYMDEKGIYEEGTPQQIFEAPVREKTRAFINRVRSYSCVLNSPDFDLPGLNAGMEAFCEKQILPRTTRHNLLLVAEELLLAWRAALAAAPVEMTVAYTEKTEILELVFEQAGPEFDPLESHGLEDDLGIVLARNFAEELVFTREQGRNRLVARIKR